MIETAQRFCCIEACDYIEQEFALSVSFIRYGQAQGSDLFPVDSACIWVRRGGDFSTNGSVL